MSALEALEAQADVRELFNLSAERRLQTMTTVDNAAVLALRQCVQLVGDDALSRVLPTRQGNVELALNDGRVLTHFTQAVRGMPPYPVTWIELVEKCDALMAPVLGASQSSQLCNTVFKIDAMFDMRQLRPLLKAKSEYQKGTYQ